MTVRRNRNHGTHETAPFKPLLPSLGFAIIVTILISFALLNHDELRIGRFMQDSMLWAEAVYRMSLGQEIHRDFQTPIGTLMFIVPSVFYDLTGSMSMALKASHVAFGTAILAAGLIVTVGRMQAGLAFAVSLFCCLAVATPVMFGGGHQDLTVALHYNRLGWAALFIILLALLSRKFPSPAKLASDSVVVAALVLLLFFTKISFFLSVIGLFVVGLCCVPGSRKLIAISSVIVAVALAVIALAASSLFWAYLENVQAVVAVSGNRLKPLSAFLAVKDEIFLFLAGCCATAAALVFAGRYDQRFANLQIFALLFAVFVMSLMNFNQNFQYRILMTLLFPWFLAANIIFLQPDGGMKAHTRTAKWGLGLMTICLVLLGPIVDWARAMRTVAKPVPDSEVFVRSQGALEGIVQRLAFSDVHDAFKDGVPFELTIENFPDQILGRLSVIYWRNTQLGMSYIDGLETLEPLLAQDETLQIETIDFMNPFPMLTQTVPPRGVMIARSLREIDFDNPPAPELWFAEADIVLIPKYPQDRDVSRSLVCAYADFLSGAYQEVSESGYWQVYRRGSPEGGAGRPADFSQCDDR